MPHHLESTGSGPLREIEVSRPISPVIVVPTHRNQPTTEEEISLRQLARIMGHREIVVLTPHDIDVGVYREILPTSSHVGVHPRWMASHASYNRMIISPLLASLFRGYPHLLLCEPDSLVLADSLDHWCQQPYDYIGAPWFQPNPSQEGAATFIPGANSGFSLFRLSAMRKITSSWRRWYPVKHALGDLRSSLRGNRKQFRKGMLGLYPGGLLRGAHLLYSSLCDQY